MIQPYVWWAIAIYLAVSFAAITFLPHIIAPKRASERKKDQEETIDLRNKIRTTVAQVAGGLGFLFSIFIAVQAQDSSNRDQKARFERETAELFVKSIESKNPEALYVLGYIARRDKPNYRLIVNEMLASIVKSASTDACGLSNTEEKQLLATARTRIAMRILHDSVEHDEEPVQAYNLEGSCLTGLDLGIEQNQWGRFVGLRKSRISRSTLLRVDFRRVQLQNAELMGIDAGDWRNPGWSQDENKYRLHELDESKEVKWKAARRKYVAHFIDTDFTDARFDGAGLEGSDFSGSTFIRANFTGANISRANFKGAWGLSAQQLRRACVGGYASPDAERQGMKPDDRRRHEQPIFDPDSDIRKQLYADPELRGLIPLC